ncbi:hypothetical protein TrCOL_g11589 [Triparma columacea]|uniref:J domain-containing protein n=1 Tax=Triparma columacea TaxID=722753 RepID=A0A9W7LAQ9_9STRA|nr:hypothetical protein TrCOL_g11589 [Triparma columacea]
MLQELIETAFPDAENLYSIFGISNTATTNEIKKAYFKMARKCHPDKLPPTISDSSKAQKTAQFQAISGAYEILSDVSKRSNYDQYGLSSDDSMGMDEPDCGWTEYFNAIYQRVDEGKIKVFKDKYKGSDEERRDVLKWYKVTEGDLGKMLECVMLSTAGDFKRWVDDYINPAVENGDVQRFEIKGWDEKGEVEGEDVVDCGEGEENVEPEGKGNGKKKGKGGKKKKKKMDEEKEAEELMNAIRGKGRGGGMGGSGGGGGDGDLAAMILGGGKRKNPMEDMLKSMEERYGGATKTNKKKKTKKKKEAIDDPLDDAEFERIQAEMLARRK